MSLDKAQKSHSETTHAAGKKSNRDLLRVTLSHSCLENSTFQLPWMNHALFQIQAWCILSHLPGIPSSHCLPNPPFSCSQILFSFSSQFLKNTSHDLPDLIIPPCILNFSLSNIYHISSYLFNVYLP